MIFAWFWFRVMLLIYVQCFNANHLWDYSLVFHKRNLIKDWWNQTKWNYIFVLYLAGVIIRKVACYMIYYRTLNNLISMTKHVITTILRFTGILRARNWNCMKHSALILGVVRYSGNNFPHVRKSVQSWHFDNIIWLNSWCSSFSILKQYGYRLKNVCEMSLCTCSR